MVVGKGGKVKCKKGGRLMVGKGEGLRVVRKVVRLKGKGRVRKWGRGKHG